MPIILIIIHDIRFIKLKSNHEHTIQKRSVSSLVKYVFSIAKYLLVWVLLFDLIFHLS